MAVPVQDRRLSHCSNAKHHLTATKPRTPRTLPCPRRLRLPDDSPERLRKDPLESSQRGRSLMVIDGIHGAQICPVRSTKRLPEMFPRPSDTAWCLPIPLKSSLARRGDREARCLATLSRIPTSFTATLADAGIREWRPNPWRWMTIISSCRCH